MFPKNISPQTVQETFPDVDKLCLGQNGDGRKAFQTFAKGKFEGSGVVEWYVENESSFITLQHSAALLLPLQKSSNALHFIEDFQGFHGVTRDGHRGDARWQLSLQFMARLYFKNKTF